MSRRGLPKIVIWRLNARVYRALATKRTTYYTIGMRFYLALFLIFTNSALAADIPSPYIPNREAFLGWQKKPYNIDEIDFSKLETITFHCGNPSLEAMSQDQSTKKYHKFVYGGYDTRILTGDSEACLKSSGNKLYCLQAQTLEYTIMSDIYRDHCGNRYRAFWEVQFFSNDESMGTLCSLGRTFYEKANSEFPGEIEIGPTYPIDKSRFLFFTKQLPEDTKY